MHSIQHTNHAPIVPPTLEVVFVILAGVAILIYLIAVKTSERKPHLKRSPRQRIIYWISGIVIALSVMTGPLADTVHTSFSMHMVGHLLLGMLAPLLLVLAAPMTLFLRALPVTYARKLTKLMRSRYVAFVTHPITASILNIGGLWVLYTTNLFQMMHESTSLYLLVHLHVFLAGYVFTAAMIYIDPTPYRFSYLYRTITFILALAGHQILSKYIYAYPPDGVDRVQAEIGGMLMYYGGNLVDLIIIYLICLHWYRSAQTRSFTYQHSP